MIRLDLSREPGWLDLGHGVRLRVLSVSEGVKLGGIEQSRVLTGVTRLRRGNRNQLFLESPPGIPFMADGNPCYFAFTDGRARLISGRMRGEVRINNRIDSLYELLPEDLIDVLAGAKFRLEVFTRACNSLLATSSSAWLFRMSQNVSTRFASCRLIVASHGKSLKL